MNKEKTFKAVLSIAFVFLLIGCASKKAATDLSSNVDIELAPVAKTEIENGIRYTFPQLPQTRQEMRALDIAHLENPHDTAALCAAALARFAENPDDALDMLLYLCGEKKLDKAEIAALRSSLEANPDFAQAYFVVPEADDKSNGALCIDIYNGTVSFTAGNDFQRLRVKNLQSDDLRDVTLRKKKGQFLLSSFAGFFDLLRSE